MSLIELRQKGKLRIGVTWAVLVLSAAGARAWSVVHEVADWLGVATGTD